MIPISREMSDFKHATDRVDGVIVANCTECDEYTCTAKYETAVDDDILADFKRLVGDECPYCGGSVGVVNQETPTEVLD